QDVAFASAQVARGIGQVTRENPAQPGRQLATGLPAKLRKVAMGLQQRLLHHIRGVQLRLPARIELGPGQQAQVVAELWQLFFPAGPLVHRDSYLERHRLVPECARWCKISQSVQTQSSLLID